MNEPSSAKLVTRRLAVSYGGLRALEPVDLDMQDRTVTALVGPSGCGKSSFLRALNRMHDLVPEARVEGKVLLEGVDVLGDTLDVVDVRRRIGMVFQRSNPFPKSIFDNVAYGLRVAGLRDKDELVARVEESLRRAGLWVEVRERLAESALALSGGQQQRLCIARAIATRPEVLLLDEPASALDPIATEHVERLIGELRERMAVVVVTHSLAQAKRVSDRLAFFYLGHLVEFGPTRAVLEAPTDPRTREYVTGRVG